MTAPDTALTQQVQQNRRRYPLVALSIGLLLVVGLAGFAVKLFYALRQMNRPFDEAAAAMQRPENYVPAELYLARLWQSDPKLMHSDSDVSPPDWTPPEIGRLQPHYFNVGDGFSIDGGGGMIDSFGYELAPDRAASDQSMNAYTLTYRNDDHGDRVLDHFTIPASERLTEEEFVKLGLAELSRREAAIKSGNPLVFGGDPLSDRQRLLRQHPGVAGRLGVEASTANAAITR